MTTTSKRPVFLNLFEIKLPVAGIMSILHRLSGALLFAATPLLIYLLDLSLSGEAGFAAAHALIDGWLFGLLVFVLIWSLLHHLLAGIRFLLIDADIGVDKPLFRQTALAVLIAAPVLALLVTGVML